MSFNNIEIARLRIQEAQQNGMRDAAVRRILAEQQGEQKVSWLRLIIKRWIERSAQLTANSQQEKLTVDSRQLTESSRQLRESSRQLTANSQRPTVKGRRPPPNSRQWTADS